jgi:LemA protein
MKSLRTQLGRLLLVIAIPLALTGCGFNTIPTLDEQVNAKWADVQNQYQRRADLIPNLVSTVKGYAAQEERVLVQVTQARAGAMQVKADASITSDAAAMQRYQAAQNNLTTALIPFQRLQEAYPDLKSNQNFLALQSQLEGTENRISVARRDYNEAVRQYNTSLRTFPTILWAKTFQSGQKPRIPFQAAETSQSAPTVSFDTNTAR